MSTKTVTFSILKADQSPDAFGWVDVRLVDAGGGGVIVDGAIAKRARVQLDANGEGQVDLVPNDEIAPDGTFYRVTVERSSPTVVRAIQLTSSTASPVAWTDASIQVLSPVPPDWVPIEGGGPAVEAPLFVNATGYPIVANAIDVDLSGIGEGVPAAFITAPDHTGTLTVNVTLPGVAAQRELVVMATQNSGAHDVQIRPWARHGANLVPAAVPLTATIRGAAPIVALALTKWPNTDWWFVSAAGRHALDGSPIGDGSAVSDATPADLGTAAAGTSPDASRADHVHDLPTPGDIGAVPTSRTLAGLDLSADRTASALRTALGLVIGTDVAAQSSLAAKADLASPALTGNPTAPTQTAGNNSTRLATTAYVDTATASLKLPFATGDYYSLSGGETAGTYQALSTAGVLSAHPVYLQAGNYDRIAMYVATAAVSTYRLGVYPNNAATYKPDGQSLILDAGTLNMNAGTGIQQVTVTLTIPTSGIYWLAVLCDSYTAKPSVVGWSGNQGVVPNVPYFGSIVFGSVAGRSPFGVSATSVATGAMPTTFPTSTRVDVLPQITVRKAT